MKEVREDFGEFEHNGWQKVADKYLGTWGSLTNLFVPSLLDAANILPGQKLLDVACGPGFVAESASLRGAISTGVDFSDKMVEIANKRSPKLDFLEGNAQSLNFPDAHFDIVAMNFGILHLSDPPKAFAEAARVLVSNGRYVFSSWAKPEISQGAAIVEKAIATYADLDIAIPEGPDFFTYSDEEELRSVLDNSGFAGETLKFETVTAKWEVPTVDYIFELERDHGVRTAALLAEQSEEVLNSIQEQISNDIKKFAHTDVFVVPYAAHIVSVNKIS